MAEPQAVSGPGWRIPQAFDPRTSAQVRDELGELIVRDLLGPWDGDAEEGAVALLLMERAGDRLVAGSPPRSEG
jgi:hypothetical protein